MTWLYQHLNGWEAPAVWDSQIKWVSCKVINVFSCWEQRRDSSWKYPLDLTIWGCWCPFGWTGWGLWIFGITLRVDLFTASKEEEWSQQPSVSMYIRVSIVLRQTWWNVNFSFNGCGQCSRVVLELLTRLCGKTQEDEWGDAAVVGVGREEGVSKEWRGQWWECHLVWYQTNVRPPGAGVYVCVSGKDRE